MSAVAAVKAVCTVLEIDQNSTLPVSPWNCRLSYLLLSYAKNAFKVDAAGMRNLATQGESSLEAAVAGTIYHPTSTNGAAEAPRSAAKPPFQEGPALQCRKTHQQWQQFGRYTCLLSAVPKITEGSGLSQHYVLPALCTLLLSGIPT